MSSTMTSRTAVIALAMLGGCVLSIDPLDDDDVGDDTTTTSEGEGETTTTSEGETTTSEDDTTTGDGDGDTTETTDAETTDETGDGDCDDPVFVDFFSLDILLDGQPIGVDQDLDLSCTVLADNSPALVLDCGQLELIVDHQGEVSPDIGDPEGSTVAVRMITADGWPSVEKWLRLDFVGSSKSVFLIDALTLAPPAPIQWIPPWGLAIVDECAAIDDGCGEWVGQTLGVAWENQTLELMQGESGSIVGDQLKMWVELSSRYEVIGPACDAPGSWKKLAIVSSNLVESEACTPGESDPCGTGLECCYPCGVPDCNYVCTPEDPETMGCPPPPP